MLQLPLPGFWNEEEKPDHMLLHFSNVGWTRANHFSRDAKALSPFGKLSLAV